MTVRAEADPPRRGPLVFLDRDGTLIVERHYLGDPAGVRLEESVADGLHHLREARARIVVVTNQSGIARGYFTRADLAAVHAEVDRQLACEGLHLDGWYVCPHGPQDRCPCRKPAPGLIEAACRDLAAKDLAAADLAAQDFAGRDVAARGLACEPAGCFVIGDKVSDVELAIGVGGTGILVSLAPAAARSGGLVVPSFRDAAWTVTRLWRERGPASEAVGREGA